MRIHYATLNKSKNKEMEIFIEIKWFRISSLTSWPNEVNDVVLLLRVGIIMPWNAQLKSIKS